MQGRDGHGSLSGLIEIGFDGYAIGGLSVGEEKSAMFDCISHIAPQMPEEVARRTSEKYQEALARLAPPG